MTMIICIDHHPAAAIQQVFKIEPFVYGLSIWLARSLNKMQSNRIELNRNRADGHDPAAARLIVVVVVVSDQLEQNWLH